MLLRSISMQSMCCHTLQPDRKFPTLTSRYPVRACTWRHASVHSPARSTSVQVTYKAYYSRIMNKTLCFLMHWQRIWVSNAIQHILALGTQETAGGKKVTALAHFTFLLKRKGWKSMTASSIKQVIGLPPALPCRVWVRTICIWSILDTTLQNPLTTNRT